MFIQVEPKDFFMYSVKLYFDLEEPNSEDQPVQEYLKEHELEPRYRWTDELDGHHCEIMQFGGCYLGRHLEHIGQIQRHAVEVELLTAAIEEHLKASTSDGLLLPEAQRQSTIAQLVQQFHQDSSFKKGDGGELVACVDGDAIREAAFHLLRG
jgi:hypothetical protein